MGARDNRSGDRVSQNVILFNTSCRTHRDGAMFPERHATWSGYSPMKRRWIS